MQYIKSELIEAPGLKYLLNSLANYLVMRYSHRLIKDLAKENPQVAIFAFDHIGLTVNLEGRYEKNSLRLIRSYLEDTVPDLAESSAIDVGANIGNHTIFFSEFLDSVFAFEPNKRVFELLELNCRHATLNRNVRCFNFGLSDANTTMVMKQTQLNLGGSCLIMHSDSSEVGQDCLAQVRRADDVRELIEKRISIMKIDVEGLELQVLKGSKKILDTNRPIILVEQHLHDIRGGTSDVIEYLKSIDYKFYTVEKQFDLGDCWFCKLSSLLLRAMFGYRFYLTETVYFKRRYHDMIVAVPKP